MKLLARTVSLALAVPVCASAQWVYEEQIDPISDAKRVLASSSDEPIASLDTDAVGTLKIWCRGTDSDTSDSDSRAAIYHTLVDPNYDFGDVFTIVARVDDNEPIEFGNSEVTGVGGRLGHAQMASGETYEKTRELISQLRDGESVVIRSITMQDEATTFRFSLDGIDEPLMKTLGLCGLPESYPEDRIRHVESLGARWHGIALA